MQKFQRSLFFTVFYVIVSTMVATIWIPAATAEICAEDRWVPVPKTKYWVPAYPEENSTYWIFDFRTFPNMKLEITGEFPYARFMNFILYDYNGGEIATYEGAKQIIKDRDIVADQGSVNPYDTGVVRESEPRKYTIYVVNEGVDKDDNYDNRLNEDGTPKENTLVVPTGLNMAALFLRVYMPDNKESDLGEVALPKISVINLNNGIDSACPPQQMRMPDKLTEIFTEAMQTANQQNGDPEIPEGVPQEKIYSYNPGAGWGLYPNGDNPYLIAPLFHWTEKVATMKFKAPTYTATRYASPGKMFKEDDQVRYFSVCMGGYIMTNTSACLSDEYLKTDGYGFIRIAVVPDGMAKMFENDPLWNVFEWGKHLAPALLYRQIDANPSFENSFVKVLPAFSADKAQNALLEVDDVVALRASEPEQIGEYGPEGIYCTLDEFERDRCGQ